MIRSTDITADKINDFLFEIEHLEGRLDNLNKLLDSNQLKVYIHHSSFPSSIYFCIQFPVLTLDEAIDPSLLFGTLEFVNLNTDSITRIDPYSTPLTNGYSDRPSKSDDEDFVIIDSSTKLESSVPNVQKKKLLWQIDYFSVPYYVRTYENQLYICDKYGSNKFFQSFKTKFLCMLRFISCI